MRLPIHNLIAPKRASKLLAREARGVSLAKVRETFSRAAGYRDWHELEQAAQFQTVIDGYEAEDASALLLQLSQELGLAVGDVLYGCSKAGLFRSELLYPDVQSQIFLAAVRARCFGPQGRGKPGTVVRVKAHGETRHAYLVRPGRPTRVYYDTGEGICADFEAVVPRALEKDFLPSRLWLPYGVWDLADGTEVVFSRDYFPLWRVTEAGNERLDPWLWIKEIRQQRWFAANTEGDWQRRAARSAAVSYLAEKRIVTLPKLVDAMPRLFDAGVESLQDAVRALFAAGAIDSELPRFASLNSFLVDESRLGNGAEAG